MRKLRIDFVRRAPPAPGGWLLLAAGIAVVCVVGQAQFELAQEAQQQSARLAALQASSGAAAQAAGIDSVGDPGLAAARQVLERSRLPWHALFAALESADPADVALLAVTPDLARRQVKIQAEARDLAAMLAFHRHLQGDAALANVVLVDHSVLQEVPETPVRFHLLANWGGSHAAP